jgi:hypothetical protein
LAAEFAHGAIIAKARQPAHAPVIAEKREPITRSSTRCWLGASTTSARRKRVPALSRTTTSFPVWIFETSGKNLKPVEVSLKANFPKEPGKIADL